MRTKESFFLILSASGGAGHHRAAEALHQAVKLSGLPIRSERYDCLDFTSRLFKQLYAQSYLQMVNRIPGLWGYLYAHTERKPYSKRGLLKVFDKFNYTKYLRSIRSLNPDVILCTHFLPFLSVSDRIRHVRITAPILAVTTDFDVHQLWIDPVVDRYYVHHEESAWQMRAKGVESSRIVVTGVPVHPAFSKRQPRAQARRAIGIAPERFTILMLSGGFGVGRVEELVGGALEALHLFPRRKFTLLAVCGRNETVRSRLQWRSYPDNVEPRIFGYVTNVHQLMDAADLLISKSGGLTSAEAMAKGLPMIVVDPIPGQETRNADLLVEHGAAVRAVNLANLGYKLQRLIMEPSLLARARLGTRALSRPHAASDIVRDAYRFLQRHGRSISTDSSGTEP